MEILELSDELARFEDAVAEDGLGRREARALRRRVSDAEELGSLIATDEDVSAEERKLGEDLASAAVSLEAALEAEEGENSAFHQVLDCLDDLSDVCSFQP